jgi:hypothetical protein
MGILGGEFRSIGVRRIAPTCKPEIAQQCKFVRNSP